MMQEMDVLARKAGKRNIQFFTKLQAWNSLRSSSMKRKRPRA